MYHKIILGVLSLLLISKGAKSQNTAPEVYLNHLFIVLDSATYSKLADSSFVTQKLGDLKSSSIATTASAWSGKYLYGRNGYFEFFSTMSFTGATLGDLGLGFMTQKADDIVEVQADWKSRYRDSIFKDTSTHIAQGIKSPWFYSLGVYTTDSLQKYFVWLMENTPEHLKSAGFSSEEISKTITWEEYMAKKNKKTFDKSFDRIKAVHLIVNQKNYEYLKASLLGFGLKQKENIFSLVY